LAVVVKASGQFHDPAELSPDIHRMAELRSRDWFSPLVQQPCWPFVEKELLNFDAADISTGTKTLETAFIALKHQ
jgi:hypothetical protein